MCAKNREQQHVALVTGATSGIGSAICDRLARSGTIVIINYHTDDISASRLRSHLLKFVDTTVIYADVSRPPDVKSMFDAIWVKYGRLDYLINNASFSLPELWNINPLEVPIELWQRSIDVDLTGTYLCSREAISLMLENGGGKIVNFSSSGSLHGSVDTFVYNPAKVGVVALTKSFAKAFAPTVQCYAIAPGSIDSGWIERWNLQPDEIARLQAVTSGIRRLGRPEEVSALVFFLLSSDGDYLTGQVFTIDGGTSL